VRAAATHRRVQRRQLPVGVVTLAERDPGEQVGVGRVRTERDVGGDPVVGGGDPEREESRAAAHRQLAVLSVVDR
jgi:hypothetical protein